MKNYVVAWLLGCLVVCAAGGQTTSDKDREGLLGTVRSMTLETSTFTNQNGDWRESARRKLSMVVYNEKGMTKEVLHYRHDGALDTRQVVAYDDRGNRTEAKFFNTDGSLNRTQIYTYDEKGRIVKIQLVRADGLFMNEDVRIFNEQGRLETGFMNDASAVYNPKQSWELSPELRFAYAYDANGRITEVRYMKGGVLDHKITYTYNGQGIRDAAAYYDAKDILIYKDTWTLDSQGKMLEHHHDAADSALSSKGTFTYKIDEQGNWIEQISTGTNQSGRVTFKTAMYRTITYY
jgi:hypothetical protein